MKTDRHDTILELRQKFVNGSVCQGDFHWELLSIILNLS
jgi:hypothetical protein